MKQKPYVINIGLNVGNFEPATQLAETLRIAGITAFKLNSSEYDGVPERTVVACINLFPEIMETYIQSICMLLEQDCIAIRPVEEPAEGQLIWSPYHRGEVFPFNPDYFIEL